MSQHAGLFFPEREWPVEEDILHTVTVLLQCFFFVLINIKPHFHVIINAFCLISVTGFKYKWSPSKTDFPSL